MNYRSLSILLLWCAYFLSPSAHASVIYQNNFEQQGPGPEWIGVSLTSTPSSCIRCTSFLGEFGNQTASLRLENLQAHSMVTVDFDLYVLRSWDGNLSQFGGPDIFRVVDSTGSLDFQTTFSNNYPFGNLFNQAFPNQYPNGLFPSQFGAAEKQSLGYTFDTNPIGVLPMDAVYHLTLSFGHSNPALLISFRAENLSPLTDESWGLDNVVVTANTVPEGVDSGAKRWARFASAISAKTVAATTTALTAIERESSSSLRKNRHYATLEAT